MINGAVKYCNILRELETTMNEYCVENENNFVEFLGRLRWHYIEAFKAHNSVLSLYQLYHVHEVVISDGRESTFVLYMAWLALDDFYLMCRYHFINAGCQYIWWLSCSFNLTLLDGCLLLCKCMKSFTLWIYNNKCMSRSTRMVIHIVLSTC